MSEAKGIISHYNDKNALQYLLCVYVVVKYIRLDMFLLEVRQKLDKGVESINIKG